jgi:hypothetical protein
VLPVTVATSSTLLPTVTVLAEAVEVVVVRHVGVVMALSSRVTAPFCAKTRPVTGTPVSSVAEVNAKMFPTKLVVWVPRVAELPTCQKTLHAWTPFVSTTDAAPGGSGDERAARLENEHRAGGPSKGERSVERHRTGRRVDACPQRHATEIRTRDVVR